MRSHFMLAVCFLSAVVTARLDAQAAKEQTLHSRDTAQSYGVYPFDDSGFKRHPKEHEEWLQLRQAGRGKVPATEESLKRQLELVTLIHKAEPNWIDGYWTVGEAHFVLGNSYSKPEDLKKARVIFEGGRDVTEACLKKAPSNPICKLFLGAALGKIASIDGIFSSLKQAKRIERLWMEAAESGVNHTLGEGSSLQGSLNYALGLYFRLVPDFFLMRWLFDVSGDINKSVAYHKKALEIDRPNTCSEMMYGIALLCQAKGKSTTAEGKLGMEHLGKAASLDVTSSVTQACARDIGKIQKDPSLACGYETSRQQETSEEEFNKLNKK